MIHVIYAHITNPSMTHSGLLMQSHLYGIDISPTVKLRIASYYSVCAKLSIEGERLCGMSRPCEKLERGRVVINSLSLGFLDILPSISGLQSENRNASQPFVQNCFHREADRQIAPMKTHMDEQLKRFDELLKAEGKTRTFFFSSHKISISSEIYAKNRI